MSGRGKGQKGTNTGKGSKTYGAKTSTPPTIMAADVRAMQPNGAGLAGVGGPQLLAQLLQSLIQPGAPSTAGGNTNVQMTPREYSDYIADCNARAKREETEKEVKLAEAIAAGVKAGLAAQGLPATTNVDGQRKKAKTKKPKATASPDSDSEAAGGLVSSSDSESAPPSPAAKARAKRLRQKKTKKDAEALTRKELDELNNFKNVVTELLAGPASDDEEDNQVKIGHLKRHLRLAVREVEKTTPRKAPKTLTPKKAAVRPLQLGLEAESAEGSEAEGSSKTPYECMMAKLGLPASTVKTVTIVAKKQPKQTATPQTRLVNLAKSFEGAAKEINQEEYPFPNPTKQEIEALQHITATIIGMMGKCDATKRRTSGKATAWTVSQTMITEGLGDVIGLRIARKQTMESYLTVLLLWLLQGGTDFNADPYLKQLMADSQSMT